MGVDVAVEVEVVVDIELAVGKFVTIGAAVARLFCLEDGMGVRLSPGLVFGKLGNLVAVEALKDAWSGRGFSNELRI